MSNVRSVHDSWEIFTVHILCFFFYVRWERPVGPEGRWSEILLNMITYSVHKNILTFN